VVVVRYFGGTLLGKAGLVQAYGEAARIALLDASVAERIVRDRVRITCTYAQYEAIRDAVVHHEGEVLDSVFSDTVTFSAALPRSVVHQLLGVWSTQGVAAERDDHEK
jgi:putative IMPACT (imprinted ancient) family translation regulator